jgi:hypothetical protein
MWQRCLSPGEIAEHLHPDVFYEDLLSFEDLRVIADTSQLRTRIQCE